MANADANTFAEIIRDMRPTYGVSTAVFTAGLASRFHSGELNESPISAVTSSILGTILPTVIIELFAPEKSKPYITSLLYGISCYKVGLAVYELHNAPEMITTSYTLNVGDKNVTITYKEPVSDYSQRVPTTWIPSLAPMSDSKSGI